MQAQVRAERLSKTFRVGFLARKVRAVEDLSFEVRRATGRDGLHDILRTVGDLTSAEAALRVVPGLEAEPMLAAKPEGSGCLGIMRMVPASEPDP